MDQGTVGRRPKRIWIWPIAVLVSCCPLWIAFNFAYERYEIWSLDRLVDDSAIPGYVAAKDARNDWPFGTSNGAYVRIHWLVVTEDGAALSEYVDGLELPGGVEAGLYDLGVAPGLTAREATAVPIDVRLYLFTVSKGRGPYDWEVPD